MSTADVVVDRLRGGRARVVAVAVVLVAGVAVALGAVAGVGLRSGDGGPPGNHAFPSAEVVVDNRFVGTTTGAGVTDAEVADGVAGPGERVVWFLWVPDHHGWAYVTPTHGDDERPQPDVRIFEGPGPGDFDRVDAPDATPGSASLAAVEGRTYAVAVVGAGAVGDFDLSVFQPDGGTRPNDEPAGAAVLGQSVFDAVDDGGTGVESAVDTLGGATAAPGEPGVGGEVAQHSVWYAWDVPLGGGSVTVAVEPLVTGTGPFRLGVWEADGPAAAVSELTLVGGGGTTVSLTGPEAARRYLSVDGPEEFYRLEVTPDGVSPEDLDGPEVSCTDPPEGWSADEVVLFCVAVDDGVGLADPDGDGAFELVADVAEGVETAEAVTDSRTVCDWAGNCTQVGPVGPIAIDRRPPEVVCDVAPQGWLPDNPEITCIAGDDGAGLAEPGDAERTLTSDVAPGEAREASIELPTVCDAVGNCAEPLEAREVQVDRVAPVVLCEPLPTGVQTDEVVVGCLAADEGSGLADPSVEAGFEVRTEVGTATATDDAFTDEREVCDVAGNCTTVGPFGPFEIDRAAPAFDCDVPAGWQRGDVVVTCEARDDGAGLADPADSEFALVATLADGEESASVPTTSRELCDAVGNCVTVGPLLVRIDNRPPEVTCGEATATWSPTSPATVECGVRDDGAGLADGGGGPLGDDATVVVLEATLAAGQQGEVSTDRVEVCDAVGNCATAGPVSGVRIDRRAPTVECDVPSGPRRTEARVSCVASDDGSGLRAEADAQFLLTTAVGAGNADPSAITGRREVCDLAGNCTEAGPFTVAVDRTDPPEGGSVAVPVPARVTVLAAVDPPGPVPAPFELPVAPGVVVVCLPAPGTVLGAGWTPVVCDAEDDRGRRATVGFPLVVKPVPELAPRAAAVAGGAWRAAGVGFDPGSDVTLEVRGAPVATAAAGDDGRLEVPFVFPASTPPGEHLVVLRGVDGRGAPHLVVTLVAVDALGVDADPPEEPPAGAPGLGPEGPAVPPDPGPPPGLPSFDRVEVPETPPTTGAPTFPLPTRPDDPDPDDPDPDDPPPTTPGDPGAPGGPGEGSGGDGGGPGDPTVAAAPAASGGGDLPQPLGAATLPVTGAVTGLLVLLGVLLVVGGGSLRAGADRVRRRVARHEPR